MRRSDACSRSAAPAPRLHLGLSRYEPGRRLLGQSDRLYMIDLCCDADLEPFYSALGFQSLDRGMGVRSRGNI